jgi:hypothetical protein
MLLFFFLFILSFMVWFWFQLILRRAQMIYGCCMRKLHLRPDPGRYWSASKPLYTTGNTGKGTDINFHSTKHCRKIWSVNYGPPGNNERSPFIFDVYTDFFFLSFYKMKTFCKNDFSFSVCICSVLEQQYVYIYISEDESKHWQEEELKKNIWNYMIQ